MSAETDPFFHQPNGSMSLNMALSDKATTKSITTKGSCRLCRLRGSSVYLTFYV